MGSRLRIRHLSRSACPRPFALSPRDSREWFCGEQDPQGVAIGWRSKEATPPRIPWERFMHTRCVGPVRRDGRLTPGPRFEIPAPSSKGGRFQRSSAGEPIPDRSNQSGGGVRPRATVDRGHLSAPARQLTSQAVEGAGSRIACNAPGHRPGCNVRREIMKKRSCQAPMRRLFLTDHPPVLPSASSQAHILCRHAV